MVNLTIEGRPVTVPDGHVDPRGGEDRGRAHPALLLPPGTSGRRRVPHVPRRGREGAEARALVRDGGRRRAGRARALGEGARGAQGRARDAAHQPSARLPDLRSGRRVRAAGLHVPGRARRGSLSRAEALQSGRGFRRRRHVRRRTAASSARAACASWTTSRTIRCST